MTSPPPSFSCPICRATSYNPNDAGEGYCGRCHAWTGDPVTAAVEADAANDRDYGLDDPIGTMRWFGADWGAPVCDPRTHIETPVGTGCERCGVALALGDQGLRIPYVTGDESAGPQFHHFHIECWMRLITGDLADQVLAEMEGRSLN